MVRVDFSASEAMFECGGALCGSSQPDSLELGPFEYVQLTYETLRVGPDGELIAFFTEAGVWSVGVQRIPLNGDWSSIGPTPDGLLFSDVVLSTQSRG